MKDLWINKWKPKDISEVIGNKTVIKYIDDWLSNFDKSNHNTVIITGIHGIGKTLIIKLLLEKYNYNTKTIYPDDIKGYRTNENFIDYYNYDNSINTKVNMKSKEAKKLALIFDETESISLTSERQFVFDIYKNNTKHKMFPLIFISNNNHSKLINDLKKNCKEFKFYSPSSYEIHYLIKKLCKKENICIADNSAVTKLIDFCQHDIRRLLNILQEYSYNYKSINIEDIEKFIESSIKKNTEIGLYDASLHLINNYDSYDEIYQLYETEKVLLPLMIHENYYKKVLSKKNKLNWDMQLNQLLNISDSISKGDNIETSIYTDQNWYLQNIHGYYTCINTSYWINKSAKELNYSDIKFSTDLNKTSLKNINKKNISNLLKIIPKKSVDEILLLCKLTNHLVNNNRSDEIINILKHYKKDLDVKDLELCLKIDKTVEFITFSTKEKKGITALI